MGKTMKNSNQDTRYSGQDSNKESSKYKSEGLMLKATSFIRHYEYVATLSVILSTEPIVGH
jgi:hypothetical protein